MFKYFIFSSIFVCVSCGEYENPLFTARDMNIYNRGVNENILNIEQFNFLIDNVYEEIFWSGFDTDILKSNANEVVINFYPHFISCLTGLNNKCWGLTEYATSAIHNGFHISVYVNDNCLGKTALIHELMHWSRAWLHFGNEDASDFYHKDSTFFGNNGILSISQNTFIKKYCN